MNSSSSPLEPGDLITRTEAAALTGLTTKTVLKLITTGEVRAAKLGGMWLIDRRSITDRFESQGGDQ